MNTIAKRRNCERSGMIDRTDFFKILPETCIAISQGDQDALERLAGFAIKLGHKSYLKDGVLYIGGYVVTGIMLNSDPDTVFVCFCFALFGQYWTFVEELLILKQETNALWVQRVKEAKQPTQACI